MSKIKITEAQYNKLMEYNENDEANIEEIIEKTEDKQEDCECKNMFEHIEKTLGNLDVRNLITEGDIIKGEVRSNFGWWSNMSWDKNGNVVDVPNKFKQLTYKLELNKGD